MLHGEDMTSQSYDVIVNCDPAKLPGELHVMLMMSVDDYCYRCSFDGVAEGLIASKVIL